MALQIVSKKEAASLRTVAFGKKHAVRQMIETLKPGETLRIGREDFTWHKKTPNFFCLRIAETTKARFVVMNEVNRTGWVVERVE